MSPALTPRAGSRAVATVAMAPPTGLSFLFQEMLRMSYDQTRRVAPILAPALAASIALAHFGFGCNPGPDPQHDVQAGLERQRTERCKLAAKIQCPLECDQIDFDAVCEATLGAGCDARCDASATGTCLDGCRADCSVGCEAEADSACDATCGAMCDDNCSKICVGAQRPSACEAACKGDCQARCGEACASDAAASCDGTCGASCNATCSVEAHVACELRCSVDAWTTCKARVQASCMADCSADVMLTCDDAEGGGAPQVSVPPAPVSPGPGQAIDGEPPKRARAVTSSEASPPEGP